MKNCFIIFFVIVYGCTANKIDQVNSITLIISNPDEIRTSIGSGIDIKSFEKVDCVTFRKKDTITISVNHFRKIYLRNDFFFNSIICQSKDTVLLDFSKTRMNFKYLNREIKKCDTLNISEIYKRELKKEISLVHTGMIKNFGLDQNASALNIEDSIIKTYSDFYKVQKDLSKRKIDLLKKISKEGNISIPNLKYNESQVKYDEFLVLINLYKKTEDEFFKNKILKEFFSSDFILDDDFIGYGYISKFITDVVLKGKPMQTIPKLTYDYKLAFDILPKFVSNDILKYSQFLCLKNIAESGNYEDFSLYKKKYLKLIENKVMAKQLEKLEINFVDPFLENLDKVELLSASNKNFNLKQIIESHQGKVIYIDFWASWCAPCRNLMPLSKSLQNEYKDKLVVFVYISIDNDFLKWEHASVQDGLGESDESYLALNYPNASFYETLNLNSIPRYLLINKNGELIYNFAPSPNSEELKTLFLKHLNE